MASLGKATCGLGPQWRFDCESIEGWGTPITLCIWGISSSNALLVTQSLSSLWGPMDCSTRLLSMEFSRQEYWEWVAISFSRGSSRPRDQTWVSCTAGGFFIIWVTREAPPKPWLLAKGPSITIFPPMSLLSTQGTMILSGYPWALWPTMARVAQKAWSPFGCPKWTKPLSPFGPFVYLSGCIPPF